MITLFVFSILVMLIGGVFVSYLVLQRRAANLQQVQENASYVLEALTKEIRVSQITSPETANCASAPATSLNFTHPVNGVTSYTLSGTDLQKTVSGITVKVNSSPIQFSSLRFCVKGNVGGDHLQPRVTIFATIQSANPTQPAKMDIQTTVSVRALSD